MLVKIWLKSAMIAPATVTLPGPVYIRDAIVVITLPADALASADTVLNIKLDIFSSKSPW